MTEDEIINKLDRLKPGEKMVYHRGATGDLEFEESLKKIRQATGRMREFGTHYFFQKKTGKRYEINGRQTQFNEFEYIAIGK